MRRKRRGVYKRFVEIRTRRNKWIVVQLIKHKGGIIVVKLPDGQIVGRKNIRVRPVTRRVYSKNTSMKDKYSRRFRTKKKRHKIGKKVSKRYKPNDKWKDTKAPKMKVSDS